MKLSFLFYLTYWVTHSHLKVLGYGEESLSKVTNINFHFSLSTPDFVIRQKNPQSNVVVCEIHLKVLCFPRPFCRQSTLHVLQYSKRLLSSHTIQENWTTKSSDPCLIVELKTKSWRINTNQKNTTLWIDLLSSIWIEVLSGGVGKDKRLSCRPNQKWNDFVPLFPALLPCCLSGTKA